MSGMLLPGCVVRCARRATARRSEGGGWGCNHHWACRNYYQQLIGGYADRFDPPIIEGPPRAWCNGERSPVSSVLLSPQLTPPLTCGVAGAQERIACLIDATSRTAIRDGKGRSACRTGSCVRSAPTKIHKETKSQ